MGALILRIIQCLYSLYAWALLILVFFFHCLFGQLLWPFKSFFKPDFSSFLQRSARVFLHVAVGMMGIRIDVSGMENLPHDRPFIMVSNHQSILDIPVYVMMVTNRFSFFAKHELLNIPFLAWELKNMDHFIVDRFNKRRSSQQLASVRSAIQSGRSCLLFPEGTRSKSGELLPFKRGAFQLALDTGVPVLPCIVDGTGQAFPKGKFMLKPSRLSLKIGAPVNIEPPSDLSHTRARQNELKETVYGLMQQLTHSYS